MLHVAIIMDGNRRWASARNLEPKDGHRAGAESLEKIIDAALKNNISTLTVFGFSTENWSRSQKEIEGLMSILRLVIFRKWRAWKEKDIKLKVIGRRDRINSSIITALEKIERDSVDCQSLTVVAAIDYGGRDEIHRAIQRITKNNKNENIEDFLDTSDIPDPDLIIRTGGEKRLSNFLLWQASYSELYFTDILWPDFTDQDLKEALAEYRRRRRRFGGQDIPSKIKASN